MTDPVNESDQRQREPEGVVPGPSRRALLGWGGAGLALGAAAAGGSVAALRSGTDTAPAGMSGAAVAFHGEHQAGIS
ncbi:deferrochelatase/peroxidase EfeB, partial [Streptomyces goshikiensis]